MDSGGALFDEAELLGGPLAHVDDSLAGVRIVLARKGAGSFTLRIIDRSFSRFVICT
jgi:hypothetical protein